MLRQIARTPKGAQTKFGGPAKATLVCPISGAKINPHGFRVTVEVEKGLFTTFEVLDNPWVVYIATH
jgi:hypothetical protein